MSEEPSKTENEATTDSDQRGGWRNIMGFWVLGLTNNFAYVVMLSAAHDILMENNESKDMNFHDLKTEQNRTNNLVPYCNSIGTGAVLLADILPCLVVKLTFPWFMQAIPYYVRVILVVAMETACFPIVSLSQEVWFSLFGVGLASTAAGLGEITYLSLTSHFDKNTVSAWSSGTGAAHLLGALSYAGLTAAGLHPRYAILVMLLIPALMAVSFFLILVKPDGLLRGKYTDISSEEPQMAVMKYASMSDDVTSFRDNAADDTDTPAAPVAIGVPPDNNPESITSPETTVPAPDKTPNKPLEKQKLIDKDTSVHSMSIREKLALSRPLVKYMVPLGLVYFAEYFINQALFELIYFTNTWIPMIQQYRWYQVLYQVGVFLSRSSVHFVQVRMIWLFSILQLLNVAILILQIFFHFLPSIWLVLVLILYEGLLGGGAYVNAFYGLTEEISDSRMREFSMGLTSLADTLGIAVAGAMALPVHDSICML